eukprot:10942753-Ditylum_brightwellii.AAC.1
MNLTLDIHLTDKYKKVVNAGGVELGKKPIAVVEHCMQQDAIDGFNKQLDCCMAVVLVTQRLHVIVWVCFGRRQQQQILSVMDI